MGGIEEAEAITAMKPGTPLGNIAGGGTVFEAALPEALRKSTLGGPKPK